MPAPTEIETAAKHLEEIKFPELQRPAIRQDDPPTAELVHWALHMYCYSLLAHFREMLRSYLVLTQNGLIPASFVVSRSLFEMAAHVYYTHKHATQFVEAGDLKSAWDFLVEINMGSRYMREEYGDQSEETSPFAAPREIAKIVRCFDEWTGKAVTEYSFLSEFAHPNMAAFSHYYVMEPLAGGYGIVRFTDPPRESLSAPWSHVSISLVACLHFSLHLLNRSGEKEVVQKIEAILETFM
jgi:hypothetical protein